MSIRKNTLWNLAGSGLPLIAAAVCIPFTLQRLGNEAFGVLTLIWALIGYFSLFDMGVGRALTYELSKLRADVDISKQHSEISLTLKAGLLITMATGAFGALLMLLLADSLATNWLKISLNLQQDAKLAFQIAALGIIPTTLTSGLRGALEGLDRFVGSNINKLILGFCMFAIPALIIAIYDNQLWKITLYLVFARFIVSIIAIIQLKNYLTKHSKIKHFNKLNDLKNRFKSLLNYGAWMTVSGIISPLMVYGDRFFISSILGTSILPLYAIPQEALQRLLILPNAMSGALLPKLSISNKIDAKNIYIKNKNLIFKLMFIICLLCAILIHPFLEWWISTDFANKALPISLILCTGILINSISFIPYTYLHANGRTKLTAQFHIIELFLYIFLLWFLTSNFGLIGSASAWLIRVSIDFILLTNSAKKI